MPSIKLRIPSNRALGKICVYGAVVSISAVMYMRWKLQDRVRSTEYYKLAMQTLRQHKGMNANRQSVAENNNNNGCNYL